MYILVYTHVYTYIYTYLIINLRESMKLKCTCVGIFKQVHLVSTCPLRCCCKIEHMGGVA